MKLDHVILKNHNKSIVSCDDITEKLKRDLGFTYSFISGEFDTNSDAQPLNSDGVEITNSDATFDFDEWDVEYPYKH